MLLNNDPFVNRRAFGLGSRILSPLRPKWFFGAQLRKKIGTGPSLTMWCGGGGYLARVSSPCFQGRAVLREGGGSDESVRAVYKTYTASRSARAARRPALLTANSICFAYLSQCARESPNALHPDLVRAFPGVVPHSVT
jgi:hypothetical protein